MSHSSLDESDKEVPKLTEYDEELIEASEPPFTAAEQDPEKQPSDPRDGENGAPLELVASAKPSINNIKSVPNGGLRAWLQVLMSFLLFFNTWGIINTFGAYQTYYEGALPSSTPSDISWIGSIQAFLLMLVGTITGPVYDAGYVHHLLLLGSFLVVFGQMMLSLCTQYWQIMLAQGVVVGIGTGCLFVPGIAILSTYFSTRIATATGLAAAGSSLGGLIYPIVFNKLQVTIGFAWATRVIGFLALGTLIVSNLVLKVRVLPGARRKLLDLSAWKELPYVAFVGGQLCAFIGLYAPFFYIQSYVLANNIMNENLAFYLLSILNAASIFGRIVPNYIADRTGPLNMIIPCTLITGLLSLCLIAAHTSASVIVIIAFYGFFSGTLVSLPPTIMVTLTKNRAVIGTRIGMGFAVVAIGLLIGTPISGVILNASSFEYVWVFSGVFTILGTLGMVVARIAQGGWKLMKKV